MSKPESEKKKDNKLVLLPVKRRIKKNKNSLVHSITSLVEDLEKQVKALTIHG